MAQERREGGGRVGGERRGRDLIISFKLYLIISFKFRTLYSYLGIAS